MPFLEAVRDVLEENQPQNDVLVFRGIKVVAQFIGGLIQAWLQNRVSPRSHLVLTFLLLSYHSSYPRAQFVTPDGCLPLKSCYRQLYPFTVPRHLPRNGGTLHNT